MSCFRFIINSLYLKVRLFEFCAEVKMKSNVEDWRTWWQTTCFQLSISRTNCRVAATWVSKRTVPLASTCLTSYTYHVSMWNTNAGHMQWWWLSKEKVHDLQKEWGKLSISRETGFTHSNIIIRRLEQKVSAERGSMHEGVDALKNPKWTRMHGQGGRDQGNWGKLLCWRTSFRNNLTLI